MANPQKKNAKNLCRYRLLDCLTQSRERSTSKSYVTFSLKNVSIVTSEMGFTELLNAFSGKGIVYRQKAVKFINHSFYNTEIKVVSHTNELFKSGL